MIAIARAATAVALLLGLAVPALAHVNLEVGTAQADATYKAVMRVPHACGKAATIAIRIQIPDGVRDVQPMPKPGWRLKIVQGPLAEPYKDSHGALVTQGIREVACTDGNLPNEFYDEFVFRMRTPPMPGATSWFPIVQECERGEVMRWIQIPAEGKSIADYPTPAAPLRLNPAR
jgi:uncharacterized protein YcnI